MPILFKLSLVWAAGTFPGEAGCTLNVEYVNMIYIYIYIYMFANKCADKCGITKK